VRATVPSLDYLIPGHDPLIMQNYPAPKAELEGIVVRLDLPPTISISEKTR
jgi:hypothetical protein